MYVKTVNQQAYSMTKMVSVTQYVLLIMLKRFKSTVCFQGEPAHTLFWLAVTKAVRFQGEPAHTLFWLAVTRAVGFQGELPTLSSDWLWREQWASRESPPTHSSDWLWREQWASRESPPTLSSDWLWYLIDSVESCVVRTWCDTLFWWIHNILNMRNYSSICQLTLLTLNLPYWELVDM